MEKNNLEIDEEIFEKLRFKILFMETKNTKTNQDSSQKMIEKIKTEIERELP